MVRRDLFEPRRVCSTASTGERVTHVARRPPAWLLRRKEIGSPPRPCRGMSCSLAPKQRETTRGTCAGAATRSASRRRASAYSILDDRYALAQLTGEGREPPGGEHRTGLRTGCVCRKARRLSTAAYDNLHRCDTRSATGRSVVVASALVRLRCPARCCSANPQRELSGGDTGASRPRTPR